MSNIFKPQVPPNFQLIELENACRICLHSDCATNLLSLFNNEIDSIISEFLPQKLNQKPLKPHQICAKCFEEAKTAYMFKKQCQFSDELIKSMLNEPNVSESYEKETQTDFSCFMYPCEKCEKRSSSNELQIIKDCDENKKCVDPICEVTSEFGSVFEDNLTTEHEENAVAMCIFAEDIDAKIEHFESEMTVEQEIIEPVITDPKKKINNIKVETKANPKRFDCTMCSKIFFRKDHLKRHVDGIHTGLRPFQCKICKESFTQEAHCKRHMNLHSPSRLTCSTEMKMSKKIKSFSCEICKRNFSTEKYLQDHVTVEHDEFKEFSCKYCSEKIIGASEYKKHCRVHSGEPKKKHLCPECGASFSKGNYLTIHIRRHTGEKPFKCQYCDKTFVSLSDQRDHERMQHTGGQNHHCTVCSKVFLRANRLKAHMRTHTQERPYKCSYCLKAFQQNGALQLHLRQHTGERAHCDFCSSSFAQPQALKKHKEKVHGVNVPKRGISECGRAQKKPISTEKIGDSAPAKLYICSECEASFTKEQYLSTHMKRHTGEKPYKCEHCDRAFVTSGERLLHNKWHTGEKNYLCTNCPKAFHRSCNLQVHMRSHTGERPYKCLYCPKTFAYKTDLKPHHRRHTGERFNCDLCDVGFVQMYVLRKHKREVHGIDVPIFRNRSLLEKASEEQTLVSSSLKKNKMLDDFTSTDKSNETKLQTK